MKECKIPIIVRITVAYLVRRKISNCAVNAYVKLRPTKPGSMESRDKTEKIAENRIIRLAHDSSLQNDMMIIISNCIHIRK